MALKHLLLSLDSRDDATFRYDVAMQLARTYDAHLTGLYVRDTHSPVLPGGATAGLSEHLRQTIAAQQAAQNESKSAAIERFSEAVGTAGISFDHHTEDDIAGSGAVPHLVRYARTADLVVLGKAGHNGRTIAHDVLFGGGVPVVVVPPSQREWRNNRVTVAWNGSREAARAVKDALPILERAASVTILCVNQAEPGRNVQPGEDLQSHLRHHRIESELDNIVRNGQSIGDAIVSRMADDGADLLVMGAWGHSRLREFVLGGVTRSILEQSSVPVLMSH